MAYSSSDGWVTLQGSKCKCNCLAAFLLRSKSPTLVCIFGDCNMRLVFTSRKKSDFRSTFEIRVLVCQDKWFVSASNWNSKVA